ncbi:hypothetical protein IHE55_27245 [Streptomyces pactum]|uniref:ATP-binding protein n=1 Tax=Streptomyces pactum TaxID=68249 RepID=A0ABS0NT06_9ACTN|nr:hypothetical protein [Streptomyces pactum]MBH5338281.1 hypothetical protein [Streptomyces pactum]
MKQGTLKALGTLTLGAAAIVTGAGSASALGAGTQIDGDGVVGPVTDVVRGAVPGAPAAQPLPDLTGGEQDRPNGDLLGGLPVSQLVPDMTLASVAAPGLLQ